MRRKHLILAFTVLLVFALMGCGVKQLLPGKKMPSLDGYSTVVILPFDFAKPSEGYPELPVRISYAMGTKLKARHEDKVWIYDQSLEVEPVSDKLAELGISAQDIFRDPSAAAKLAEAFQADLVIAGQLDEPDFTIDESGKVKYAMNEMTPTGSARYYTIHQTATLPAKIKVIDAKANHTIWDGLVIGYKKYATDYRTGSPKKSQREEKMLADTRRDLVEKSVQKLFPSK